MTKYDVRNPDVVFSPASSADLQPARRLIVLIPESEADTAHTARKIWELETALESNIQFLGLSKDATHEPGLRRQLINLSAMVRDDHVSVDSKIEIGNNWLNAVKSDWHEGDVIVCFAEQRSGFVRRPLSQILESNLKATIYVFSIFPQEEHAQSSWMREAMVWMGSIGIILGFFWLQSKLIQQPQDWAYTFLLYISLFAEVGSLWAWNSILEKQTGK